MLSAADRSVQSQSKVNSMQPSNVPTARGAQQQSKQKETDAAQTMVNAQTLIEAIKVATMANN